MARNVKPEHEAQIPAPAAAPTSGQIIFDSAYGTCVVQGLNLENVAIGDPITVRHTKGATIRLDAPSAATWAKAADVQVDANGSDAVASGGTKCGIAAFAKTAGQTHVDVLME